MTFRATSVHLFHPREREVISRQHQIQFTRSIPLPTAKRSLNQDSNLVLCSQMRLKVVLPHIQASQQTSSHLFNLMIMLRNFPLPQAVTKTSGKEWASLLSIATCSIDLRKELRKNQMLIATIIHPHLPSDALLLGLRVPMGQRNPRGSALSS